MERRIRTPEGFRELRRLGGVTLHDVQRKTGINASWICQFELGRYELPAQHQEKIFAFLLQAVHVRAAIIEKILENREFVLADARGG